MDTKRQRWLRLWQLGFLFYVFTLILCIVNFLTSGSHIGDEMLLLIITLFFSGWLMQLPRRYFGHSNDLF